MPWVHDGKFDYYGAYARPKTTYDFKIHINLLKGQVTVWYSGRGDDDWFLLAENVPLINKASSVNTVWVQQAVGASGIEDLLVDSQSLANRENVHPHPLAKDNRVVALGKGFRFQQMRSFWRQPGRHVTIARRAPKDYSPWIGFTDVVESKPGTLVAVFSDDNAHGASGRLLVIHSDDGGQTWKNEMSIKIQMARTLEASIAPESKNLPTVRCFCWLTPDLPTFSAAPMAAMIGRGYAYLIPARPGARVPSSFPAEFWNYPTAIGLSPATIIRTA